MSVQTFWLERTDQVGVGLRRYSHGQGGNDCEHGYHSALVYTGLEEAIYCEADEHGYRHLNVRPKAPYDDPRWPETCERCDYLFAPDDEWQDWQEQVYRRADNGELRVLHQNASAVTIGVPTAEVGACWNAWWMPYTKGPDGMTLMVRCPDGHDWMVDSRASNCGSPDDDEHRCWVRHGDPKECQVTVDKNGNTCSAGAGSIQTPNWHGFLRNGVLVE